MFNSVKGKVNTDFKSKQAQYIEESYYVDDGDECAGKSKLNEDEHAILNALFETPRPEEGQKQCQNGKARLMKDGINILINTVFFFC